MAATASVGATIAPSAKETATGIPITTWARTPTAAVVANTSPTESSETVRRSERSAVRSAKKAPE